MLPKENRITTKYEFNKVKYLARKQSNVVNSSILSLYYTKILNINLPTKVGIIIPNKVLKSAVARNRLKRVFRALVLNNFDKIKYGYSIVIYPKITAQRVPYEELNVEFNKVLQKILISG